MKNNRDNFTRCKICKKLFPDPEHPTDEEKMNGYKCPNGCVATFNQPAYQSPLISDSNE